MPVEFQRYSAYTRLFRKIEDIKEVWKTVLELPPPSYLDTAKSIESENDRLKGMLGTLLFSTPLNMTEDAVFSRAMFVGISGIYSRRASMRILYQRFGNLWDQPEAYDEILSRDQQVFKGRISAVTPGIVSVHLNVDSDAFDEYLKAQGFNCPETNGFHIRGTMFNFIKEGKPKIDLDSTLHHEELHALMDLFQISFGIRLSESDLSAHKRVIQTLVHGWEHAKSKPQSFPFGRNKLLASIRTLLNMYRDADYEEFIAELVSLPPEKVPSKTYAESLELKGQMFEEIKTGDAVVQTLLTTARKEFYPAVVNTNFQALNSYLERNCPEKNADLYAALVLLPPSKFRHILTLVFNVWTSPELPDNQLYRSKIMNSSEVYEKRLQEIKEEEERLKSENELLRRKLDYYELGITGYMQKYYATITEASKELGISRSRLRNMLSRGDLQTFKLGRIWFIDRDSVRAFANSKSAEEPIVSYD